MEGGLLIQKLLTRFQKTSVKQKSFDNSVSSDFFIDEIIKEACLLKASDIHLEPSNDYYRVRVRIDGKLHERISGSMEHYQNMINRIKYLANMNVAEKRAPQDGAIRWKNPQVDIRISTMPTIYGEKCVIRILVSQDLSSDFNGIGLPEMMQKNYIDILRKGQGLIIVTGPTGSGKSTTLYTTLHYLNLPSRNILTIEDPIEYVIKGINQMQIHEQRGVTFPNVLRSILRQDPDVIMIGEIRDQETADLSIRASLTGHSILSTLHTNNAISALYRLLDIGIEPYLVANGITAIVAQRLVRKTCESCKGNGCDACYFTGYYGRTGVFEMLTMNELVTDHIINKGAANELKKQLVAKGWSTMLDHGQELVLKGVIDEREFEDLFYAIS